MIKSESKSRANNFKSNNDIKNQYNVKNKYHLLVHVLSAQTQRKEKSDISTYPL